MGDAKKRYVKVKRDGASYVATLKAAIEELYEHFEGGEPSEKLSFEVVEMTEAEFDALTEFKGW